MLTKKRNSEIKISGRVLLIVCSYRGGVQNRGPFSIADRAPALGRIGRIMDRLTGLQLRRFIAQQRDFVANPRTLAYQVDLVKEVLELGNASDVTCVVDDAFEGSALLQEFAKFGGWEMRPSRRLAEAAAEFDAVVLVYPDALGLGWTSLERDLRRNCKDRLIYVNGRRRVLQLTDADFNALRWRRFFANTRLPELAMTVAIVPVGMVLATIDAFRGKS